MDPNLVLFYPNGHEAHSERGHPERPERIETIRQALQEAGLWDDSGLLPPITLRKDVLETYLIANSKVRQMLPDGSYQHLKPGSKEPPINPQEWLLNHHQPILSTR